MDLAGALDLGGRELVAFVGAGGKKTAMGHLMAEGRGRHRIGYTTTTHMPPPEDLPLLLADADSIADRIATTVTENEPIAFASERVENPARVEEKVRGFTPETIDAVAESGHLDWTLVKADGARMREFKAPGADEPAVPAGTTLLILVASVKAVGAPLDESTVHRPERVGELTGTELGSTVTPAIVGTVLAHEAGGLKNRPSGTRVVPIVNKADDADERLIARDILETAFDRSDAFEYGVVTSHEADHLEIVPA